MAKQNKPILDMINDCLLDMGRGFVNDLGQTPEASRVEAIYRSVYYKMHSNKLWPHKRKLEKLESLADLSRRTVLRVPQNVVKVDGLSYNIGTVSEPIWRELTWCEPAKALRQFMARTTTADNNTTTVTVDDILLVALNNAHPTWWTSFDDEYIVLDSYNQEVEDTVQGHKVAAWCYSTPTWPQTKEDCVDIPERYVAAYEAAAKAECFMKIKKEDSPADELDSRRIINRLLHEERVNGRQDAVPRKSYGRKRPH